VRLLWEGEGLSAVTLLTLALRIGVATAIFPTVYSRLLKPLPFHDPAAIVELYTSAAKAGHHKMLGNVPIYLDYAKNASTYGAMVLWSFSQQMLGEDEAPVRLPMASPTVEIFSILRM
jgi:putative ABC transport system permease protein